jgi:hypothetical protein
MNTKDHARILYAYLARITPAGIETIMNARGNAAIAAAHLGNSSQLAATHALMDACESAIETLIEHDRNLIAGVISANDVDFPADPAPTDEGVFTIYGNRTDCKILHYHGNGTYDVERKSDGKCFRVSGMALPIDPPTKDGACPTCKEHESHCNCQGQIDKSMGLMDQDWKLPETSQRKPKAETTIRGAWPFPTNRNR